MCTNEQSHHIYTSQTNNTIGKMYNITSQTVCQIRYDHYRITIQMSHMSITHTPAILLTRSWFSYLILPCPALTLPCPASTLPCLALPCLYLALPFLYLALLTLPCPASILPCPSSTLPCPTSTLPYSTNNLASTLPCLLPCLYLALLSLALLCLALLCLALPCFSEC